MRLQIQLDQLSVVNLKGRNNPPHLRPYYDIAYKMWSDTWKAALRELEGHDHLFSDDFKRQDEIMVLFHGREALGCVFFQYVNLRNVEDKYDSYFKPWPAEVLSEFAETGGGHDALVCSYFTLSIGGMRARSPVDLKNLLGALAIERFLNSGKGLMFGTMRNNRKMNELAYALGGAPVLRNQVLHGVEVDLVRFDRDKVTMNPVDGIESVVLQITGSERFTQAA